MVGMRTKWSAFRTTSPSESFACFVSYLLVFNELKYVNVLLRIGVHDLLWPTLLYFCRYSQSLLDSDCTVGAWNWNEGGQSRFAWGLQGEVIIAHTAVGVNSTSEFCLE